MSRILDEIKKKLSAAWGATTGPSFDELLSTAEAGNAAGVVKLMAKGGARLLQSETDGGSVSAPNALGLIQNASPAAFALLMSQPQVDLTAKKVYLRNAVYHNKPELAEVLLKDPAVADKTEVQTLLNNEYLIHQLDEARSDMGMLLIKYGADNEVAERAYDRSNEMSRQQAAAAEQAFANRRKNFGAQKPA